MFIACLIGGEIGPGLRQSQKLGIAGRINAIHSPTDWSHAPRDLLEYHLGYCQSSRELCPRKTNKIRL